MMEWAKRKKDLLKVIVRAVMNLCCVAKTKVRVGSEFREEFLVQVGVGYIKHCAVAAAFRSCSECNHGKYKRKFDE